MTENRIPVDQRELIDDNSKPATRGKTKPNRDFLNAQTWNREAITTSKKAIQYFREAAEWYCKNGNSVLENRMHEMANAIESTISGE